VAPHRLSVIDFRIVVEETRRPPAWRRLEAGLGAAHSCQLRSRLSLHVTLQRKADKRWYFSNAGQFAGVIEQRIV
jgi:hypothetical protein